MAITKLENDALSNTVTANVVSMSFGNSSVYVTVSANAVITLTNTATTQAFAVPLVAGETLTALDAVYVEPALTSGTAGRVYKLDADVLVKSTQAFFAGFALAGASAGAKVNIQTSGIVSGFVGLTVGAMYYASATAGAITATKPLHPLPLGIAVSATQLLVNLGFGPSSKREDEQSENVSAVYGYAMGGSTGSSEVATADRITFSTGVTVASTASNLSAARQLGSGVSDTTKYGYVMGGVSANFSSLTDRITFSTSVATASTVSNLSSARFGSAGFSDGSIFGYIAGGYTGANVTTTDRITFSTSQTAISTASNLSLARNKMAGVSDASTYGYAAGGYSDNYASTTDRLTFSTGVTTASTVSNLSVARYSPAGVSDGAVYGYVMGGYYVTTTTDRITFSTSVTAARTISNLSSNRYDMAGVSDGMVYGYTLGGYGAPNNTYVVTSDRITFSTGVTTASTTSNLSTARSGQSGLSDGAV